MSGWAAFERAVRAGLGDMGLPNHGPAPEQMARFAVYLEERSRVMNLTAITEPEQMAVSHFLDSAALLGAADFRNARVIDVGTGAGFPGLPLKLLEPTLSLSLLDSQQKRVAFLREAVSLLSLEGTHPVQARAEEQSRLPGWRDAFDLAVSRAVADLRLLLELCLPFVRLGGRFLAMKSREAEPEIAAAAGAVVRLGGRMLPPFLYTLPGGIARQVVIVEKIAPTPPAYPRRFAKMRKEPL